MLYFKIINYLILPYCHIMNKICTIDYTNIFNYSQIIVTMWANQANSFHGVEGDILGIMYGKIVEYKNLTKISIGKTSKLILNPDWEEAKSLKTWYGTIGQFENIENFTQATQSTQEFSIFEGNNNL